MTINEPLPAEIPLKEIGGLDLLRFAAAAMVLWFHFANTPELSSSSWWGWVGVEIFFVISGFVIAFSAETKTAFRFARSRFLRLYPAVWICASVTALVLLIDGRAFNLLAKYSRSMALIPVGYGVDGSYWTLGIEMAFYGLIFLLLLGKRFHWLPWILYGMTALSGLYWLTYLVGIQDLARNRAVQLAILPHGCFFALGGFLWLCAAKKTTAGRVTAIVVCLVAGCVEIFSVAIPKIAGTNHSILTPAAVWLGSVGIILASIRYNHHLLRWAKPATIRLIGLATYPLYLLHHVVGAILIRWGVENGVPFYWTLGAVTFSLLVTAFIIASSLEPRMRRLTANTFDALSLKLAQNN